MNLPKRLQSPWNLAAILSGIAILGAGVVMARHASGGGCGKLIFGRYSAPYFAFIVGLLIVGGAIIWNGIKLDNEQVRRFVRWLVVIGLIVVISLSGTEIYLRLSEKPDNLDDLTAGFDQYFIVKRKANYEFTKKSEEFENTFSTDELGLIMRDGEPNYPDPDARRILMLGNSILDGLQVPPSDNMSEVLEKILTDSSQDTFQVINAAMTAANPITYLMSYDTFGDYFDPDIVIVVFYVRHDLPSPSRYFLSQRAIQDTAKPEKEPDKQIRVFQLLKTEVVQGACQILERQIPSGIEAEHPDWQPCIGLSGEILPSCDNYLLINETLIRNNSAAIFKDQYSDLDWEDVYYSLDLIDQLAEQVEQDDRQFLLVIIPRKAQVPNQPGPPQLLGLVEGEYVSSTKPQSVLLDFCEAEEIECLDMLPIMRAESNKMLFWQYDGHLTENGHQLAAESIAHMLLPLSQSQP